MLTTIRQYRAGDATLSARGLLGREADRVGVPIEKLMDAWQGIVPGCGCISTGRAVERKPALCCDRLGVGTWLTRDIARTLKLFASWQ